jgi:hypothetical protein
MAVDAAFLFKNKPAFQRIFRHGEILAHCL